MKELISKEAAIKTVFSMCCRWDNEDPNDLKLMLLSAFQELPPIRQWIPCSEQLPEEGTDVLITDEDGDIDIARYEYNSWSEDPIVEWWSNEYRTYAVAWMPLIEPYEVKR